MSALRLMKIASMGSVTAFLLAGAAYADTISDYCEEVDQNVASTAEELADASGDLTECSVDLDDCMHGLGLFFEPSRCIRGYGRCTRVGKRDQRQACERFLREWGGDTRRAERDGGDAFLTWIHGDSASRNECLDGAVGTAEVCADQLFGE
jgi:hypothetical protein